MIEAFLFAPGQTSGNEGVTYGAPVTQWAVEIWQRDNRLCGYTFKKENAAREFHSAYQCAISDMHAYGLTQ